MKKNIFLNAIPICFVLLLAACGGSGTKTEQDEASAGNSSAADAVLPVVRKYGVKSGIVTYENSGFGMTTKRVLYFDDWGTREAEETYDSEGNLTETNMCDGKNMILLVHKDKTAFKRGECFRGVAYKFNWEEAQRSGDEYKPTKLSNQNIAGKDCESFSLTVSGNINVYAGWNNICLLMETNAGQAKISTKAVSLEENANVPAEKFAVPADYKVN